MDFFEFLEFISVFRPFFVLFFSLLILSKVISFLHKRLMYEEDYEFKLELSDLPKPDFLEEHLIKVDIDRSIKACTGKSRRRLYTKTSR